MKLIFNVNTGKAELCTLDKCLGCNLINDNENACVDRVCNSGLFGCASSNFDRVDALREIHQNLSSTIAKLNIPFGAKEFIECELASMNKELRLMNLKSITLYANLVNRHQEADSLFAAEVSPKSSNEEN